MDSIQKTLKHILRIQRILCLQLREVFWDFTKKRNLSVIRGFEPLPVSGVDFKSTVLTTRPNDHKIMKVYNYQVTLIISN